MIQELQPIMFNYLVVAPASPVDVPVMQMKLHATSGMGQVKSSIATLQRRKVGGGGRREEGEGGRRGREREGGGEAMEGKLKVYTSTLHLFMSSLGDGVDVKKVASGEVDTCSGRSSHHSHMQPM